LSWVNPGAAFKASLFVFRTRYHLLFFSLARTELKGTATSFPKPPDANNQGRDTAFLVDQHVIDVADLVVRRVVNILLVEVGQVTVVPAGNRVKICAGPRWLGPVAGLRPPHSHILRIRRPRR
jgi:hypothetical protein